MNDEALENPDSWDWEYAETRLGRKPQPQDSTTDRVPIHNHEARVQYDDCPACQALLNTPVPGILTFDAGPLPDITRPGPDDFTQQE